MELCTSAYDETPIVGELVVASALLPSRGRPTWPLLRRGEPTWPLPGTAKSTCHSQTPNLRGSLRQARQLSSDERGWLEKRSELGELPPKAWWLRPFRVETTSTRLHSFERAASRSRKLSTPRIHLELFWKRRFIGTSKANLDFVNPMQRSTPYRRS